MTSCFSCTVGCKDDEDCAGSVACVNERCIDPCIVNNPCGENARCSYINGLYECQCEIGYKGDPYDGCANVECFDNSQCSDDRHCLNTLCRDPCKDVNCVQNAKCAVTNHIASCRCSIGFIGDPKRFCHKPTVVCQRDQDCPNLEACIGEKCEDACSKLQPCGKNAECSVLDKKSVVIMACTCPEGFDGDAKTACRPSKFRIFVY